MAALSSDFQSVNDECQQTSPLFLGMQFGVKSLPGIIFMFAGTIRYLQIKHMAKSAVRYSKLFKVKVGISGGMTILSMLYFLFVMLIPADKNIGYLNACDRKPFLIIYLI
jgi:hypothetical protein